jgi:vancomycin resistance protein YoaR
MTWDTREPRNQAKPSNATPKGSDGPGWWSEGSAPAPKPASLRSTGAAPSVRAVRTAPAAAASSATRTDGMLSARKTRGSRTASKSSSQHNTASLRLVVGFAVGVFGALFIATVAVLGMSAAYDGKILPGVHAGSVDVSGMSRDEAVAKIGAAYATLGQGQVTITTPAGTEKITYAELGRTADAAAMADAAMAVGHGGDTITSAASTLRTFAGGTQVPLMIKLDPTALAKILHTLTDSSLQPATDAKIVGSGGKFTITPSATGRGIDESAIQADVIDKLLRTDAPSAITVGGKFVTIQPSVSDADAQSAIDSAGKLAVDVNLSYQDKTWKIDAATIKSWIVFGFRPDGSFGPVVDPSLVATYIGTLGKDVNVSPKQPTIKFDANRNPIGVTGGTPGMQLDASATAQAIEVYLDSLATGGTVTSTPIALVVNPVNSALTDDPSLTGFVEISGWQVTYFPGEANGFGTNIALPAKLLNGQVVSPGETFSFLRAVTLDGAAPIDAAHGWKLGGVIKNGQSNHTGAMGGGICSASTTMFQAAARAGLQINERHAHFYWIDRYFPQGMDATVYSNGSTTWDMRWTNDTPYPIVIKSWTVGGRSQAVVHVQLWSKPLNRKVVLSKPVITDPVKASTGTQYVSSLPPGVKNPNHKEYATDGFNSFITRTVTDPTGSVIHYDEWYSHYTKVDGILQIRGTPQPSHTPTPTPGPATPKPTPVITPPPAPTPTVGPRRRPLPRK